MTEQRCPWQWRHLHCALPPRHPSPHHIVGEQPDFDRVEKTIAQQERERLRAYGDRMVHAAADYLGFRTQLKIWLEALLAEPES